MKATLLVVEDNSVLRKMMRVTLETEGYRVLEAGDAETALQMLKEGRPQLVFQDLVLPGMDGFELVRRIRGSEEGADIPIVACSGFISKLEEARISALGFDDFLLKPIEPTQLVEAARRRIPAELPSLRRRAPRGLALIVDDDRLRLKLAALQLGGLGFEVAQAGDGLEALAIARQRKPRIIVSDLMMPRMDGFALCLEVRKDPRLEGLPIVLYTSALIEQGDLELARSVGANRLIVLTGEIEPLADAIQASLAEEAPRALADTVEAVDQQRTYRVIRRMQRHLALSSGLNQRCAIQSAELSVLEGIAHALTSSASMEVALEDILSRCLEAGEITVGALYRRSEVGFVLEAMAPKADPTPIAYQEAFGYPELLDELLQRGGTLTSPSEQVPPEMASSVFERAGLKSFVLAPVPEVAGPAHRVLLFGASQRSLADPDAISFTRGVASQISVALSLKGLYEKADEAIHVRDDFLGVAAHELRTPLTTLGLRLRTLLTALAEPGADLSELRGSFLSGLETSLRQTQRLAKLIDELLDVVRVTSAKLHLDYEPLDAAEVIQEIAARQAEELRRHHCELRLSLEQPLPGEWDRLRLEQIVLNLLSNAMKYGQDKPIDIELVGNDERAILKVTDHGIGISDTDQARIFERFERAASSRHYGGFGLGLWIVKQILDAMGGEISVFSQPGVGSTFIVEMPRRRPMKKLEGPARPAGAHPD